MKKALLITSLLVITALTFTPAARAFSINFGGLSGEDHNGEKDQECEEVSHGAEIEEDHESGQAKLHENEHEDDNEDCATASPTATPTGTPTFTPTGTPISIETATPTSTPIGSPTPTESPLVTAGLNLNSNALETLSSLIKQLLEFLQSLGSRER